MATPRDDPYGRFNFLVDLGGGETEGPGAGFMEVTGLGVSVDIVEYRNGNDRSAALRKISGLTKVSDVVLRRGVIGSLGLWQWLEQVRQGDQNAHRTVTIRLQSEDRSAVAQTWRLLRARPRRYVVPSLDALGSDVAIEELVLAAEDIEVE